MIHIEPTSRHPVVIYLLVLLAVSGVTIWAGAPAPGSVEAALPPWGVNLWAGCLVFGSTSTLLGLHLQPRERSALTGVLCEQVGMAALAAGGYLYAAAAVGLAGWAGIIPAGLVLGLAAACSYRYESIRRQLRAHTGRGASDDGGC